MSQVVDDQRIGEIGWAPDLSPRPAPLPDGFGPALRVLRERRGLNQKQLADRSGLTPSQITRLEHGQRGPSQESIQRLAKAVEATPEEFNHLLAAAGFLPEEAATLLDEPDVVRLSAVLADPRLTPVDRRMLLTYVRLAVEHAEARGYGKNGVLHPEPQPTGPHRGRASGRRAAPRDRLQRLRAR